MTLEIVINVIMGSKHVCILMLLKNVKKQILFLLYPLFNNSLSLKRNILIWIVRFQST